MNDSLEAMDKPPQVDLISEENKKLYHQAEKIGELVHKLGPDTSTAPGGSLLGGGIWYVETGGETWGVDDIPIGSGEEEVYFGIDGPYENPAEYIGECRIPTEVTDCYVFEFGAQGTDENGLPRFRNLNRFFISRNGQILKTEQVPVDTEDARPVVRVEFEKKDVLAEYTMADLKLLEMSISKAETIVQEELTRKQPTES